MSTSVKDIENTLAISTGMDDEENYFYINVSEQIDANPVVDITENARVMLLPDFLKENSLLLKKVADNYMIFQLQKSSKNFIYNDSYEFIQYNEVGSDLVAAVINEEDVVSNAPALDSFNAATVLAMPFTLYKNNSSKPQTYTITHQPDTKNITILITTITP